MGHYVLQIWQEIIAGSSLQQAHVSLVRMLSRSDAYLQKILNCNLS
jgi:hypothetical protein